MDKEDSGKKKEVETSSKEVSSRMKALGGNQENEGTKPLINQEARPFIQKEVTQEKLSLEDYGKHQRLRKDLKKLFVVYTVTIVLFLLFSLVQYLAYGSSKIISNVVNMLCMWIISIFFMVMVYRRVNKMKS
jgi:hypothetical protein